CVNVAHTRSTDRERTKKRRHITHMRSITLSICLILLCLSGQVVASPDQYWIKFDEYSNVRWNDEAKRLDRFNSQLRNTQNAQAYLAVYGGSRSCPDEARLR